MFRVWRTTVTVTVITEIVLLSTQRARQFLAAKFLYAVTWWSDMIQHHITNNSQVERH